MPFNIQSGNSAQFVVRFTNAAGTLVSNATAASVTLTYNVSGVANSSTVDLTEQGTGFWAGTWSSEGVDLGLVDFSVTCSSTAVENPAQAGQLRIID